jgi:hypothetical protein
VEQGMVEMTTRREMTIEEVGIGEVTGRLADLVVARRHGI